MWYDALSKALWEEEMKNRCLNAAWYHKTMEYNRAKKILEGVDATELPAYAAGRPHPNHDLESLEKAAADLLEEKYAN